MFSNYLSGHFVTTTYQFMLNVRELSTKLSYHSLFLLLYFD